MYESNYYDQKVCVNKIYDVTTTPSASVIGEGDIQDHLKITETDDFTYVTVLIAACQAKLEQYCGLSFANRTITANISNIKGHQELPYGPIISVTSVTDKDGNAVTDYVLEGLSFKTLKSPCCEGLTVVYQAGYTTIPNDLKMALLNEVAYRYDHRGDEPDTPTISSGAQAFCNSYRRMRFI